MKSINVIHQKKERGQSLPELAFSFIMLIMLLLGAADFGRAFFTWMSLRDMAQEGSSSGSFYETGSQCNEAIARALNGNNTAIVDAGGVKSALDANNNNIQVSCTVISPSCDCPVTASTSAGDTIKVTATYSNFPLTAPFLGTIVGTQYLTINATIRDTLLVPGCY